MKINAIFHFYGLKERACIISQLVVFINQTIPNRIISNVFSQRLSSRFCLHNLYATNDLVE